MTSVNFQQWIQHPETLNRDTLYELRNLLARYPYFQSLRLLYLKNLYILHDISFGGELRKAVLYIADRRQLFRLIEGDRYDVQARKKGVPLTEVLKDEPSVDRTLALIDAFLSTVPEEVTARTSFDYSMDYTSYLLEETPATEQPAEETPKLKGYELIDDFIEKSESDSPLCMKPLREEMPSSPTSSDELTEEETIKEEEEDDSCFTETLAKIYVKQQRYSKALEIIKKLSLKSTWGLAIFMVVMSIATAYVVPRSAVAKDAVLEQAQKEQQTNPYNLPAGTAAPQTEAPATNAPATETPAPATETPAPAAE